ncbi:hypothetical protein VPH35_028303 [Triticum aestivum]
MSWPDLPAELIARIADRITSHADLARFRSVCPSWRSASAEHAACRRVPLLLLPTEDHFGVNRPLWSLADDTVVEVPVPAVRGFSFLYASPHGWTLGVADDLSATLLHPFTSASESLPALPPSFRDNGQEILCDMVWDKSPDAVMVSPRMGAYFCRLRPGDGPWSPVGGCSQGADHVSSITYCDGTVNLLDGRAETFDVAAVIEPPDMAAPPHSWLEPESALIVSSGELLLIPSARTAGARRPRGRRSPGATSATAPCSWTTSEGSASRSTGCGGTASTWPARTRSSPMSTWWTATGATPCPCSTWTTSLPSPSRSGTWRNAGAVGSGNGPPVFFFF